MQYILNLFFGKKTDGFTGIKDVDSEILLKLDNREFIIVCGLNKYFIKLSERNNYLLYKRKLQLIYPDTLNSTTVSDYKRSDWKGYYVDIMQTISRLKGIYKFNYEKGNPFLQLCVLSCGTNQIFINMQALYGGIRQNEISLVIYAVNNGVEVTYNSFVNAGELEDITILKYFIEHGISCLIKKGDIKNFSIPNQQYLKSIISKQV